MSMVNEGIRRIGRLLAAALTVAALLAGCGSRSNLPEQKPVAIHKGDRCAVCGMYIEKYPGPRGEAYIEGRATPLKFGSTRDFFAFVLQPENATRLQHLYVQDTAHIDWGHPSNAAASFIDARKAYYVAWQPLKGAMGPTFASFAKRSDAEAFKKKYGGQVLTFKQVTPEMLSLLSYSCPAKDSPVAKFAEHCVPGTVAPPAQAPNTGAMPGMKMSPTHPAARP